MKRARIVAGLLAGLLFVAADLQAQSLTVQYVEGIASQRTGTSGSWAELSVGDEVSLDASVKLEKLALVQLKAPGSSITLTQPGTYALRRLVAAGTSLRAAGAVQAAAIAFSRVLKGSGKRVDAVGGVRSEAMPRDDFNGIWDGGPNAFEEPPSSMAADASPARQAIESARDLIASEDYNGAIARLWDALPSASEDEAREARFYLASAHELAGDSRSALAELQAASPKSGDAWAPDSVLLGARLLEDTFAWAQARDLLVKSGPMFADDAARMPTWLFLLALAYHGTGEKEQRDLVVQRIVSLDPAGDLAVAASRLQAMP